MLWLIFDNIPLVRDTLDKDVDHDYQPQNGQRYKQTPACYFPDHSISFQEIYSLAKNSDALKSCFVMIARQIDWSIIELDLRT